MENKTNNWIFIAILALAAAAFATVLAVSISQMGDVASRGATAMPTTDYAENPEEIIEPYPDNESKPAVRTADRPAKAAGTGFVTGRVVDTDGKPIPGVRILANTRPGGDFSTETGEDGTYALKNMPAGVYQIEVERSNFVVAEMDGVAVAEGGVTSGIDFILHAGGGLKVSVFGSDRAPVGGAKVTLLPAGEPEEDNRAPARRTSTTANDGSAVFQFIPAGSWKIRVRHGAYLSPKEDLAIDVQDGAGYTREVILDRGSSITGDVVSEDGTPVAGARVTIRVEAIAQQGRVFTRTVPRTREDGSFDFPGLEPGDYDISAEANGYIPDPVSQVRLGISENLKNIRITMRRGLSIGGTCSTESGEPLAGVRVNAHQGRRTSSAQTDNAGEFFIQGLENQPCSVQAYLRGYQTGRAEEVQPGTRDLKIVLKPRGSPGAPEEGVRPPTRRGFGRSSPFGRNRGEGERRPGPNPPSVPPAPPAPPSVENESGK
jgi:hypothetical protein